MLGLRTLSRLFSLVLRFTLGVVGAVRMAVTWLWLMDGHTYPPGFGDGAKVCR